MNKYKYVIVGGGMTGDAAVKGIRELDREGSVAVISAEAHPPYSRPPLSKGLWKNTPEEKIWRKTQEQNAELILNVRAAGINNDRSVQLESGEKVFYDKLLLATGGITNKLPFGSGSIIYYRTYDDYKKLRELASTGENFAVIGGGFIGTEIAAALAMSGKKVTMIFPEKCVCGRVFPDELAEYINDYYEKKGVELVKGESVIDIASAGPREVISTKSGRTISADAVVAGVGIKPDTSLAEAAGIEVDNGIIVDEHLQTSMNGVYAAGDVANFYNPHLGKRIRVEHEDNANKMGKHAGRAMAGDIAPYNYLPFFYSDMFELGYEAIGELDSRMEIFADWKEKFKEGVLYYLSEGRVRGVLLWNVWGQVDEARKLIGEKGPFRYEDLKGKLPEKK